MTTTTETQGPLLNVIQQPQVQSHLREVEAEMRREEGIETSFSSVNVDAHFKKPVENDFTADQRPTTTLLFGGFTFRHEHLIRAHFQSQGYPTEVLPTPNTDSFQMGKEYGNNGQCNPTYFTVGNLVQFLQHKRDVEGMSTEDIIDRYFFITAGACGPCRFGMYEAEYRLALRNSGFDGFRVMLFQQKGGLKQGDVEAGLKMDTDFFSGLVTTINMGDLLNEVANQMRPFEVIPGETDRVMYEALDYLEKCILNRKAMGLDGTWAQKLKRTKPELFDKAELAVKFLDLLTTSDYSEPLREVARRLDEVELDRFQPKPVVKVTGEFWAQTTEGDGNFNMFRFLQAEGAEIITEPIATWLSYMMWQEKIKAKDRHNLVEQTADTKWWDLRSRAKTEAAYLSRRAAIGFADKVFRREYDRLRLALGGTAHPIVDMWEMEDIAHEFYHTRSEGGEGHLEVAKNIYYTVKGIAHMVLSLKPFGCMPSTQSDGAQSAVINRFKEMIYLPIETSGEGEINAHSRVQMALGEAKSKAKNEFKETLGKVAYPLDQMRAYVDEHSEMKRPMYHVPEYEGVVGTAARFVTHVAELMQAEGIKPTPKLTVADEAVSAA